MRINASNPAHRGYSVFLDGLDVSTLAHEADDISHTVRLVVRDRKGNLVRDDKGRVLTAVALGHVVIVPRPHEAIESVQ